MLSKQNKLDHLINEKIVIDLLGQPVLQKVDVTSSKDKPAVGIAGSAAAPTGAAQHARAGHVAVVVIVVVVVVVVLDGGHFNGCYYIECFFF